MLRGDVRDDRRGAELLFIDLLKSAGKTMMVGCTLIRLHMVLGGLEHAKEQRLLPKLPYVLTVDSGWCIILAGDPLVSTVTK